MKTGVVIATFCLVGVAAVGGYLLVGTRGAGPVAPPPGPAAPALPAGFFLASEPPGAKQVEDAKAGAGVGQTVTLRGRIGGSMEPFVEGRAVFTIVGRGIPACCDIAGHGCDTPWDYCHEPVEDIAAHSATVQVVDGAGGPIKVSVKGLNGVKELSDLVVVGRVSQVDGAAFVVDATGVFVVPE